MNTKQFCGACLLALTLAGAPAAAQASEITVSAAASLTNAFTEIVKAFEAANPSIKVHTNFASSNALLKQMEVGAPVDVFATADQQTMDKAQAKQLIDPASRRDFALNTLVMIVPQDSRLGLKKAADLQKKGVQRIAVGTPESVPAGRYAKAALTSAGLWDTLAAKYVFGNNVRQVLDYVKRGEADAGFVYCTDALIAKADTRIVATMSGHEPVLYPIAVALGGSNSRDGAKFVKFVLSRDGRATLSKYGFSKPVKK